MNFISRTFANGVKFNVKDEGGQECFDFMSVDFKLAINISMVVKLLKV